MIYQLIDKKCLPFSMVIVASRPVATNELRKVCSRRVEVIGFSKSQIYEYVETYPFNGSDKVVSDMVSKLKLYLGLASQYSAHVLPASACSYDMFLVQSTRRQHPPHRNTNL